MEPTENKTQEQANPKYQLYDMRFSEYRWQSVGLMLKNLTTRKTSKVILPLLDDDFKAGGLTEEASERLAKEALKEISGEEPDAASVEFIKESLRTF